MKYLSVLLVVLLAACGNPSEPKKVETAKIEQLNEDGCNIDTSSKLVSKYKVSPILNLVKDKEELGAMGRCTVKFDIVINDQTYHLEEVEEGLEQLDALCYYARERARKNLLLDLGGDYESESKISCKRTET